MKKKFTLLSLFLVAIMALSPAMVFALDGDPVIDDGDSTEATVDEPKASEPAEEAQEEPAKEEVKDEPAETPEEATEITDSAKTDEATDATKTDKKDTTDKKDVNTSAATSGNCGPSSNPEAVTWTLSAIGTLTIKGSGEMGTWDDGSNPSPWNGNTDIKKVIIDEGVTSIGAYAFRSCTNLTEVKLPDGLKKIKSNVFRGCTKLESIKIPGGVTELGTSLFAGANNMKSLNFIGTATQLRTLCGGSDPVTYFSPSPSGSYAFALNYFEIDTANSTAPTCTRDGRRVYKFTGTPSGTTPTLPAETIPATGHTERTIAAVAATCTATGLTAGKDCSVCGQVLQAQAEVPAKGHTWGPIEVITLRPTCTEDGTTEKTCDICGTTEEITVPATGHQWDDGYVSIDPTTSKKGQMTFTCTACGAEMNKAIPKIKGNKNKKSKKNNNSNEGYDKSKGDSKREELEWWELFDIETGDNTNLVNWGLALILSAIALLFIGVNEIRRRTQFAFAIAYAGSAKSDSIKTRAKNYLVALAYAGTESLYIMSTRNGNAVRSFAGNTTTSGKNLFGTLAYVMSKKNYITKAKVKNAVAILAHKAAVAIKNVFANMALSVSKRNYIAMAHTKESFFELGVKIKNAFANIAFAASTKLYVAIGRA